MSLQSRISDLITAIGTDIKSINTSLSGKQPLDTDLTAIAALTSAADKVPYATGAGTWALSTLTSAARGLLDDADASAMLTTLGVSTFIKGLLDDADATAARATLSAQASDADLTAIAALASAADKLPYATGAQAWALTTLTAAARSLLDDADAATMLATLGAQPSDADLTAIAALTSAADKVPYSTGAGTWALTALTSTARSLLDDTSVAAMLTTLGAVDTTDSRLDDIQIGEVGPSADTNIASGTHADVTGCTVTPTIPAGSVVLVFAVVKASPGGGAGANAVSVYLSAGGSEQTDVVTITNNLPAGATVFDQMGSQVWKLTGLSGATILKLRCARAAGSSTCIVRAASTKLFYLILPNAS